MKLHGPDAQRLGMIQAVGWHHMAMIFGGYVERLNPFFINSHFEVYTITSALGAQSHQGFCW